MALSSVPSSTRELKNAEILLDMFNTMNANVKDDSEIVREVRKWLAENNLDPVPIFQVVQQESHQTQYASLLAFLHNWGIGNYKLPKFECDFFEKYSRFIDKLFCAHENRNTD